MSFGSWLAALPLLLKMLVILGIVIVSFVVGASFVASTLQAWKFFADLFRKEKNKGKKD